MNTILQRLIDMDNKKRLHHGFLFIGTDKSSDLIKSTVQDFVLHLFSKETPADIVEKKLAGENHPDFFKLSSEEDIKIENVRELQKWLFLPPLEASKKIAIIENAQHLNASCSNALLKTLEEPPPYALIILQTNSASRILQTIRSRLFSVQFPDEDKIDDQEKQEWMDKLETMLAKRNYSDKEVFTFTEQFSDQRENLIFFFNFVHKTIRDQMFNADAIRFNRLEKMFDLALNLEQELYQSYGNISLGLDRFFIEWRNT
ncbi:MAG: hypothetical protein IT286_01650 [Proteobacteria bacterium]|jgi:DNA polymerase III delta prime subunit|nr:hypothetical protein [Pseudomonadota bacterium]